MHIEYIDNFAALEQACAQLGQSPVVCVDTEFHRENTYYPELALIQLANTAHTYCIDPLAIKDLKPLQTLFANTDILKVFHAAWQDMEIFLHAFGNLPAPVFDTQIAAALLGMGEQIGYAALIQEYLGLDVDKSQTRTDWMQRPLSDKQIEYAGGDVYHLCKVYPMMAHQLHTLQREDWLADDFRALANPQNYIPHPPDMWRKIKANQKLRGIELAILQALAAWREITAQQRNKPRKRIINDDALIDIARQKPTSPAQIFSLRSMQGARLTQDDASTLIQCIEQAGQLPQDQWPKQPKFRKLGEDEDALADALTALLKQQAALHKINPASIASRKQLEALVTGERDIPLLQGWRIRHGGQILLDFLDGKTTLAVRNDKLVNE
ncbi:MAG: ribonuclease [Pseudomonadota bacterium]|nr:ribonuclease [Pseudomonadota bacterium]